MPSLPQPQSSESFKRDDAASYDDVADRFEQYTEQVTVPIARRVVERAGLKPSDRVLDVGCGTGVLCRLSAGQAGSVVGLDLSEGMLRKAAALAAAAPHGERIEFRRGDAERLEFEDTSFDAVISLYALRHLPNPRQALAEMARVGRRGSPVVVGVGSAPPLLSGSFLAGGLWAAMDAARSLVGRGALRATGVLDRLVEKHLGARAHGHGTADAIGDLVQAMRSAGYVDVHSEWLGQMSTITSVDEFWGLQVTLSTGARKTLAETPAAEVQALRDEFDAVCKTHLQRGGTLVYRSGALIVRGRRPA